MHNFGKMALKKVPVDHPIYKFIGHYFDENDVEWHDNYKKHPYAIYAMVDDGGQIVSWQEDPEQSQIDGIDIWGFTEKEAEQRGDHTHFDGSSFYTPEPEETLEDKVKRLEELVRQLLEK